MKKRTFLQTSATLVTGSVFLSSIGCVNINTPHSAPIAPVSAEGTFTLPPLGYDYQALEPHIDAQTMEIHHTKHHQTYVDKLNAALKDHPLAGKPLTDILPALTDKDTAIRNNGGGHYNHAMFWQSLSSQSVMPTKAPLADALQTAFGSPENFKQQFSDAAKTLFGSGWVWLCADANKKLFITTTPNQDNPLMKNLVKTYGTPLLGLDVWEHAYYLKYQNMRTDYIAAFFAIINWEVINQRFKVL